MEKISYRNKLIKSGRLRGIGLNKTKDDTTEIMLKNAFRSNLNGNKNNRILDARAKLNNLQFNKKRLNNRIGTGNTGVATGLLDAREILLKKQQKEQIRSLLQERDIEPNVGSTLNSSLYSVRKSFKKQEPLVIVTGLGNVRKQGNKLKVIKKPNNNTSKLEKLVISDAFNTLVHLNNNKTVYNKQDNGNNDQIEDSDHEENIDEDYDSYMRKYNNLKLNQSNKLVNSNRFDTFANNENLRRTKLNSQINFNNSSNDLKIQFKNGNTSNNDVSFGSSSIRKHLNDSWQSNNHNSTRETYNNSNNKSYASNYNHDDTEMMDYDNTIETKVYTNSQLNNSKSIENLGGGFRLVVSNLHSKVTEDDILELFSDIGPIKRARFLDKGLAEVVYVKLDHAYEAIDKYNEKELDGRPMIIELTNQPNQQSRQDSFTKPRISSYSSINSSSSFLKSSATINSQTISSKPTMIINSKSNNIDYSFQNDDKNGISSSSKSSPTTVKDSLSNRFKAVSKDTVSFTLPESKKQDYISSNKVSVDSTIINSVLFNKKTTANTNPVTFTVKL